MTKRYKDEKKIDGRQNTTQKTKNWGWRTHTKMGVNLGAPEGYTILATLVESGVVLSRWYVIHEERAGFYYDKRRISVVICDTNIP